MAADAMAAMHAFSRPREPDLAVKGGRRASARRDSLNCVRESLSMVRLDSVIFRQAGQ
jgi:hypothetical protein